MTNSEKSTFGISTIAIIISIAGFINTCNLQKKQQFDSCVDDVKKYPQSLEGAGRNYSREMNLFIGIKSALYESRFRKSSRKYSFEVRRILDETKKFSCNKKVLFDLNSSINMISSASDAVLKNQKIQFDLIIKSLDKISRYDFIGACCTKK